MADGLLTLIFLCFLVGTASYLAGILPLSFSLSSRQLRLITALGTGVLVGTSLIVIIPEGIDTLYSASGSSLAHARRAGSIMAQRAAVVEPFPGAWKHDTWRRDAAIEVLEVRDPADPKLGFRTGPDNGPDNPDQVAKQNPPSSDPGHDEGVSLGDPKGTEESPTGREEPSHDPHAYVGISLISGFILMYLIDTIPQTASGPSAPQRFQISLNQFSLNRTPSIPNETAETPMQDTFSGSSPSHTHGSRPSSTTVGLVIHAAADGIALGASSTTRSRLSFIIFLATMVHKAPAAFGLTTVLLKQGLSKRMARAHLIVFSLAAPLGALLTWSGAHLLGYTSSAFGSNRGSTEFATGVLLLFSGGTFLYVAMHTMQEGTSGRHAGQDDASTAHGMNGYTGMSSMDVYEQAVTPPSPKKEGLALLDVLVTVGGMLLPLLTQWGHVH